VATLALPATFPTHAQDGGDASTTYQLNMRAGAGTNYDIMATLPAGTPVILEARNGDTSWVLGHTVDNAHRGWLASLYLTYQPGYAAVRLPVSSEVLNAPAQPAADDAPPAEELPAAAPTGGVGAFTNYQMNVRSGPGTNHSALGQIAANTGLVLEARNSDTSWVLFHTEDGAMRGWVSTLYLRFSVSAASLPVSNETIAPAGPGPGSGDADTSANYGGINMGGFDPARVADIDLAAYPVVGRATGRARAIFLDGQSKGRNPNVVTSVGDCSSEHWAFLSPFAWGEYNLGGYGNLQPAIDHFGQSLAIDSQADHNGFNANAVLAPEWAYPGVCQTGENPLQCEFRVNNPSVAVIMFGTSDLLVMTPAEFDFFMREIVRQTIDAGVIPILSTFPGNMGFWDRTILYNQIVVRIALDNDIPLINLWLALESLPNHGLEPDGFHLGETPYGTACVLTAPYLQNGYPVRNLVTMQTLDAVWRGAMQ
jgi:uncharacterized protein YraI